MKEEALVVNKMPADTNQRPAVAAEDAAVGLAPGAEDGSDVGDVI